MSAWMNRNTEHSKAYPTDWSGWEWNHTYNTYSRFRLTRHNGDYEYEYSSNPAETPNPFHLANPEIVSRHDHDTVPYVSPDGAVSFQSLVDHDHHVAAIHSNHDGRPYTCSVEGCSAGVQSWVNENGLLKHNSIWHGHTSEHYPEEIGYPIAGDGGNSAPSAGQNVVTNQAIPRMIRIESKPRHPSREDEKLDKTYRIFPSHEFRQFRLFKVLWSEPEGSTDDNQSYNSISVRQTQRGGMLQKVRRFLIINPMQGHALCLPLNSYLKQGVMKRGVHAEHHTIAFTTKPEYIQGERDKGMTRPPIQIDPAGPQHKLEPSTRLNYAKIYTIEYNVKVCFIGKVNRSSRNALVDAYNEIHPPISSVGEPSSLAPQFETLRLGAISPLQGSEASAQTQAGPYFSSNPLITRPFESETPERSYQQERDLSTATEFAEEHATSSALGGVSYSPPRRYQSKYSKFKRHEPKMK